MDAFGDNFDQPEVDPAAEFLAREQSALAGLEDDLLPAAAISGANANSNMTQPRFDDVASMDSMRSFEIINNTEQNELINNAINDTVQDAVTDTGMIHYDFEPAVRHQPQEEPEQIKKWREEQKTSLEEKDREEEKKKNELRDQAKKVLDDWYKQHEESISKTKSSNKNAEKQFVAETDEIEPGTEWERIAKLCDFNPKSNKSSRDVSRMRSIILQLKQNPIVTAKRA